MWKYFFLGLLAGWLIEWIIDWLYWRRSPDARSPSARGPVQPAAAAAGLAGAHGARDSTQRQADADAADSHAIEPNARTSTSADTPAGRITTTAPVYRQEDLEAIAGIGPSIGAMLRNNGITTFAELAGTPVAELIRIVDSTGEQAGGVGLETWAEQAQLAAAQDWAGLAALQRKLPSQPGGSEA